MELMHKDINTVTRMAREYKIPMLMANLVQEIYGYALAHGDKRRTTRPSSPAWKTWPGRK
jgi:3-hydroxyisobutyrate dehydrogenase-like beta-hydroxyacid dehydrogenase